jgi:hypothetical protein
MPIGGLLVGVGHGKDLRLTERRAGDLQTYGQ